MKKNFLKSFFPTFLKHKKAIMNMLKFIGIFLLVVLWILAFTFVPFLSSLQDGFMGWYGQYR